MSYSDFLNLIGNAFTLFIDTITKWCNVLIHNYFFITILGAVLFCSFVLWCVNNIVLSPLSKKLDDIDNYISKYNDYDLYQKIRFDWYKNHREMVYNSAYDRYTVNKNIRDMYNQYNSSNISNNVPSNPEWLGKDIIGEELTPEEEKELTDILADF